ncbi:MAG: acetoin utilization protein AcuC [Armatimonas sp.]
MARRTAFLYTDEFLAYNLGSSHPLQQRRLRMVHDTLKDHGVLESAGGPVAERMPTPADLELLKRVHTGPYLDAVEHASREPGARYLRDFGLGPGDTPAFPDIWPSSRLYAGGSIDAAQLVTSGEFEIAFNVAGGLHHAHADRASGFCTFNDLALAVLALRDAGYQKVAYIDIDVHHGDGVQFLFWDDPDTLTISLHESPEWLFPRVSGYVSEVGGEGAEGTAINIPFAPATGDAVWLDAFEAIVPEALSRFQPDALVLQTGADAHVGDPLAHLALSTQGWLKAFTRLLELGADKPIVVTGGGGYNLETVRRLWSMATAACAGIRLDALHDTSAPRLDDEVETAQFARKQLRELRAYLGWDA